MFEVYIDGASQGNPGLSGAGILIKRAGLIKEFSLPLGIMSNHQAEFYALIHALSICQDNDYKVISVRTDSKLVCDAIEKEYVKNKNLNHYLKKH